MTGKDKPTSGSSATDVCMETDDAASTNIYKRPPGDWDPKDRDAAVLLLRSLILHVATTMGYAAELTTSPVIDLDASNAIAGGFATVFRYLRKKENKDSGVTEKWGHFKITNKNGGEQSVEDTVAGWQPNEKFDFKVATPMANFITAFKLAFDEARSGVTKFAVRETGRGSKGKKKGRENTRSLADFGFNSEHIPLLEGATYPPERRTGLLRGLGPGTLAVIALHETEYADKPLAALKESIKMLGMADSIIQVLKNKPKEGVQDMLRALMDVLLLTTARTTHRMYLPIIVFY